MLYIVEHLAMCFILCFLFTVLIQVSVLIWKKCTSLFAAWTCHSLLSVPEPEVTSEHKTSDKLFAFCFYQRVPSKSYDTYCCAKAVIFKMFHL